MKIAVTYDNGNVFQHFGKTENFKVYELNEFTSETPDTALSPTKLTIKVSTIPTNITNNCSKNNGMIMFFKSLFVNVIIYLHDTILNNKDIKVKYQYWRAL